MLSEFFDGKALNKRLNPDEAVAYGATVQAGILSGNQTEAIADILLMDVIGLSLGVSVLNGDNEERTMSKIIEKNTPIPVEKTKNFNSRHDNQESIC